MIGVWGQIQGLRQPGLAELATVLLWVAVLSGLLLLLAVVVAWVRKWTVESSSSTDNREEQAQLLREVERLYREGEISAEEYQKIRSTLRERWRGL
jgi:uncharacterized membrane protein